MKVCSLYFQMYSEMCLSAKFRPDLELEGGTGKKIKKGYIEGREGRKEKMHPCAPFTFTPA